MATQYEPNQAQLPPVPGAAKDVDAPAVSVAAVVVYPGANNVAHVLTGVCWSYDTVPATGNVIVQDGSNTILSFDITAAGPGYIPFPYPKEGTLGESMTITLKASAGSIGKVDALNHWLRSGGNVVLGNSYDFSDPANSFYL